MSVNCDNVIDISTVKIENINQSTYFYVDTNIWRWFTSVNADEAEHSNDYAAFANQINKNSNTKMLYSHLTFSELTSVIENKYFKDYKFSHKLSNLTKKQYRSIPEQRDEVVQDISGSIDFISEVAESDDSFLEILNYINKEDYNEMLKKSTLDGTDILMALFMKQNGVKNIITDDRDYLSIGGINVFTYNQRAIKNALQDKVNTDFSQLT